MNPEGSVQGDESRGPEGARLFGMMLVLLELQQWLCQESQPWF